ncbi:hypothetical protein [Leifsonia sp. TF02-11]|uniref:ParB family protein n=1 Tax=Leifsonia sp. TF02-11 TaxID=2815212 RepID=UPI0035B3568D
MDEVPTAAPVAQPTAVPQAPDAGSVTSGDATDGSGPAAGEQATPRSRKTTSRAPKLPEPGADEDANAKVPTTLQLRAWIRQRAQTAVLRTAGMEGGYTSMQAFVEGAMLRELDRLQREFNNGEPYPPNQQGFRTGRPLGS